MAYSPVAHDRDTRFTNYSSIHSADAFVGDYQVMYTPGASPQQSHFSKPTKKSTRFGRAVFASKQQQNHSQSYVLPSNIPNTSQIMPDHGPLPNIQVHYNIPADEKQIVASLRSLQRDLNEAIQTINEITKERDEALQELRILRTSSKKHASPPKRQQVRNIEEELFDLSSPLQDTPKHKNVNPIQTKRSSKEHQPTVSDEARVLTPVPINLVSGGQKERKVSNKSARDSSRQHRKSAIEDDENSMLAEENPTAASNTSRRRRRPSMDDNMTSAYILPDITVEQQQQQKIAASPKVSRAAQNVIHSLEPEHIANCDVCYRLTIKPNSASQKQTQKRTSVQPVSKITDFAENPTRQPDYTAALAGFIDESMLGDATMRPKMSPSQALLRVKILMSAQFQTAKERHRRAWEKYDNIEAPLSSKKHAEVSKEMRHWAEKMEECRVHLDYLRDVEEGMMIDEA